MIRSFRCKETERLFQRDPVRRFKAIESVARRKLEWRVCFVWREGGAERVEIVDYH